MFKIKHLMDAIEPDDGRRLWVEPIGLTRDLRAWCGVHCLLPNVGPPVRIWKWFADHPGASEYEYFRGVYHEHLARRPRLREPLLNLIRCAAASDLTLLHQGDEPARNTATALYEFLGELGAFCLPDE